MTEAKDPKDPKEGESFFRKVVRFVANPGTDWTDLNSRQEDARELELEKSELKAMIERKRRNDFVRKREFDMLRKVRREGLSPEQLAALGTSSKLDDSAHMTDSKAAKPEAGVKAKIDEIEKAMVGDSFGPPSEKKPPAFFDAPTEPAVLTRPPLPDLEFDARVDDDGPRLPALPPLPDLDLSAPAVAAPAPRGAVLPPLAPMSLSTAVDPSDFGGGFAVEVSEVVHDPELDEAVIAFANADFEVCEGSLRRLTQPGGSRAQHAETWLVLFDHYRATGQQQRFESLAIDYAQQFGWSAPQWYSLPKMVSESLAQADDKPKGGRVGTGDVGWVCPEELDIEAVGRLRSQTLQMPLPWVFDWGQLRRIDAEAAMQLSSVFRLWAGQALEMRWIGGERLFAVLQEAAPTGVRDADPVFWLTRLDALRLVNRPDQFDETAIDYCVTYEVSPPSWEATRCNVRISSSGQSTRGPELSLVSEPNTGFVESGLIDDAGSHQVSTVDLSGQLVGDIGNTLRGLDAGLGIAPIVNVSCARLIRVDFIAAGDLLNWVLTKRSENRLVQFVEAHRLVALFFGAMGINEHAKVQVRKV
jgi:hypothetical protein